MATSVSPPDAAPSQEPAASGDEQPTAAERELERDIRDLEQVLANARRNLDIAGVPR